MKFKENGIPLLIVAMSLATAWAVRGQFGHEQGAAWAGAIGGLALVLVSNRKDWYNKMILVALASAVGWGAGGMISYGVVVGYGRADNFINAFYGLSMLFVIGALFGLLGGGLVGLVLDSTEKNKVKWGALLSEMVAGGVIGYYFLVEQIGFKMTPPRSEAWAIIFGAGLAMLWYMAREKRNSAIRVALFTALGSGFGFAFGNFLQVIGNVLEITFNMWNVMEYSIGFFGGLGLTYSVFTSKWPVEEDVKPKMWTNRVAFFIVVILIPFIVYRESLAFEHMMKHFGDISNLEFTATLSTSIVAVVMILMSAILFWKLKDGDYIKKDVSLFLFSYLAVYIFVSYAMKGLFAGHSEFNHHLYILNIVLIFVLIRKQKHLIFIPSANQINTKKWLLYFSIVVLFIALLSFIAINSHGELGGSHNRFPIN
jgi:hypothetical protein